MARGLFVLAMAGFQFFAAVFFSGRYMGLIDGEFSRNTCYFAAMLFFITAMVETGLGMRLLFKS